MPLSEAQRADLYTGLSKVLGPERAELLMTHQFDMIEVATSADMRALRGELNDLRIESREGLAAVNQRLDRLFLTFLVGMFGMVAAMVGIIFNLP